MKILIALILPFALSGCMLELLTTTAIQGELAAKDAQAGVQAINYTKEFKAKIEAKSAIDGYFADKGSYPPSLAVLVPGYISELPKHVDGSPYGYDPATGALLDSPAGAPAVPYTEEDRRNLGRIEDAIYTYWKATSDYPRTLAELAPLYIDKVPALSSGGAFVYDPQTGAVYHPSALSAPAFPGARPGGRAPGSLNEVTAGIGIQNQLRNMNNSGTQAVRGTAVRGLQGVQDGYNQRQQRALDNIDQ